MAYDKETIGRLKKERGKIVATDVARVSGYENLNNATCSVPIYENGVFIEGLLSTKGVLPLDKILNVTTNDGNISTWKLVFETSITDASCIEMIFDNPLKGFDYYVKLCEFLKKPLSSEEISTGQKNISEKKEQKKQEIAEQNRIEREKRTAEAEARQAVQPEMRKPARPETRKEKIKRLQAEDKVYCPKCLSAQITANKKGFSVGQAITFGSLAGFIGSNKIIITCLSCGHKFKPGDK